MKRRPIQWKGFDVNTRPIRWEGAERVHSRVDILRYYILPGIYTAVRIWRLFDCAHMSTAGVAGGPNSSRVTMSSIS